MTTDFRALLVALKKQDVEFIVIGGAAAAAHGAIRLTLDLDVVYRRTPDNFRRLAAALDGLNPYLRGAPPGLPFLWDAKTIERGLNFTLTTSVGNLDVFGEIVGGGDYNALLPQTVEMDFFGLQCRSLNLRRLIEVKSAAGRPKDLEAIAELRALQQEKEK